MGGFFAAMGGAAAGTVAGAWSAAKVGAILGTVICPGLGSAIGGILGSVAFSVGASVGIDKLFSKYLNDDIVEERDDPSRDQYKEVPPEVVYSNALKTLGFSDEKACTFRALESRKRKLLAVFHPDKDGDLQSFLETI